MSEVISKEEFQLLQSDVAEIKKALLGSAYGEEGMVRRVNSLCKFKDMQEKRNNIIRGILIALGIMWTAVSTAIVIIFNYI